MLFLSYLTALLCTAGAAFAAKPKVDKFERFQSLSHGGAIDLNDKTYNEITAAPRDYFTAVLLTAMDSRFGCVLCREFQPEWDIIARSWNKGQVEDINLVFGTLDFTDGKETFKNVSEKPQTPSVVGSNKLQLMLQTAPVVLVFPPSTGPYATADGPFSFEFTG
jgi:oligosaccharyltransferase complex subunit gamma